MVNFECLLRTWLDVGVMQDWGMGNQFELRYADTQTKYELLLEIQLIFCRTQHFSHQSGYDIFNTKAPKQADWFVLLLP